LPRESRRQQYIALANPLPPLLLLHHIHHHRDTYFSILHTRKSSLAHPYLPQNSRLHQNRKERIKLI
jgi:hypothetical protein